MERRARGRGKKRLLDSHQRCWVWGRNAVVEILRSGRWRVLELYLADRLDADASGEVRGLAEARGLAPRLETPDRLAQLCHSREHQGHLAKMAEYPYVAPESVLQRAGPTPFYLVLDGIQDPFNFGNIARSAEVLGVDAVFIGLHEQVGVTAAVARCSAGAVNHLAIARVHNIKKLVRELRERGIRVVAASEKADQPVFLHDFTQPTALVVGSEGRGVSPGVLAACDARLQVPQQGRTGSLNAGTAAGIVLYEARRQRLQAAGERRAP